MLVPHLRNRSFTLKRSPYGVGGEAYFQKQAPKGMPAWIPTRTYRTYRREGGSRLVDFPLVNSPEALLWKRGVIERFSVPPSEQEFC